MTATLPKDLATLKSPLAEKIVFLRYSPIFGTIFENFGSIGLRLKIKPFV